jgi:hypothetical protein
MQQPARYLADFPPLYDQRMRIRTMIDRCEESMLYIQQWVAQQGWNLDFQDIEILSPKDNTVFKLLEPYIQPSPAQTADVEQKKISEFEVEY